MFPEKFKQYVASLLIVSMVLCTSGFFMLAGAISTFANEAQSKTSNTKNYYYLMMESYEETTIITQKEISNEENALPLESETFEVIEESTFENNISEETSFTSDTKVKESEIVEPVEETTINFGITNSGDELSLEEAELLGYEFDEDGNIIKNPKEYEEEEESVEMETSTEEEKLTEEETTTIEETIIETTIALVEEEIISSISDIEENTKETVSTESEIVEQIKVSTSSEVLGPKLPTASNANKASESVINISTESNIIDIASESEVVKASVSIILSTSSLISSLSNAKWKIKRILIATISTLNIAREKDISELENKYLAKSARIVLVDANDENERIIRVPISWVTTIKNKNGEIKEKNKSRAEILGIALVSEATKEVEEETLQTYDEIEVLSPEDELLKEQIELEREIEKESIAESKRNKLIEESESLEELRKQLIEEDKRKIEQIIESENSGEIKAYVDDTVTVYADEEEEQGVHTIFETTTKEETTKNSIPSNLLDGLVDDSNDDELIVASVSNVDKYHDLYEAAGEDNGGVGQTEKLELLAQAESYIDMLALLDSIELFLKEEGETEDNLINKDVAEVKSDVVTYMWSISQTHTAGSAHKTCAAAYNTTCTHITCGNSGCVQPANTQAWSARSSFAAGSYGGYYFLSANANVTGICTLTANTFICLNGFNLIFTTESAQFVSNGAYQLHICNCSATQGKVLTNIAAGTLRTGPMFYGQYTTLGVFGNINFGKNETDISLSSNLALSTNVFGITSEGSNIYIEGHNKGSGQIVVENFKTNFSGLFYANGISKLGLANILVQNNEGYSGILGLGSLGDSNNNGASGVGTYIPIQGLTFENNTMSPYVTGENGGGILYLTKNRTYKSLAQNIEISNCDITDNIVSDGNQGLMNFNLEGDGKVVKLGNITLNNNQGNQATGVFKGVGENTSACQGISFRGNNYNVEVDNVNITNNTNIDSALLTFANNESNTLPCYVNIDNTTIQNNTSQGMGIISFDNANSTCTFNYGNKKVENNEAKNGGVIFARKAGKVILQQNANGDVDSNYGFFNNKAQAAGGVVYSIDSEVSFNGGYYSGNSAVGTCGSGSNVFNIGLGGVVYANADNGDTSVSINKTQFVSNEAKKAGGVLYIRSSVSEANLFVNGDATNKTIFDKNKAYDDSDQSGLGGAIFLYRAKATINNAQFTENESPLGGAIYNENDTVDKKEVFLGTTKFIDNNKSVANSIGGTIYTRGQYAEINMQKGIYVTGSKNPLYMEGGKLYFPYLTSVHNEVSSLTYSEDNVIFTKNTGTQVLGFSSYVPADVYMRGGIISGNTVEALNGSNVIQGNMNDRDRSTTGSRQNIGMVQLYFSGNATVYENFVEGSNNQQRNVLIARQQSATGIVDAGKDLIEAQVENNALLPNQKIQKHAKVGLYGFDDGQSGDLIGSGLNTADSWNATYVNEFGAGAVHTSFFRSDLEKVDDTTGTKVITKKYTYSYQVNTNTNGYSSVKIGTNCIAYTFDMASVFDGVDYASSSVSSQAFEKSANMGDIHLELPPELVGNSSSPLWPRRKEVNGKREDAIFVGFVGLGIVLGAKDYYRMRTSNDFNNVVMDKDDDSLQAHTLVAVWERLDHIHKVCGCDANKACTHENNVQHALLGANKTDKKDRVIEITTISQLQYIVKESINQAAVLYNNIVYDYEPIQGKTSYMELSDSLDLCLNGYNISRTIDSNSSFIHARISLSNLNITNCAYFAKNQNEHKRFSEGKITIDKDTDFNNNFTIFDTYNANNVLFSGIVFDGIKQKFNTNVSTTQAGSIIKISDTNMNQSYNFYDSKFTNNQINGSIIEQTGSSGNIRTETYYENVIFENNITKFGNVYNKLGWYATYKTFVNVTFNNNRTTRSVVSGMDNTYGSAISIINYNQQYPGAGIIIISSSSFTNNGGSFDNCDPYGAIYVRANIAGEKHSGSSIEIGGNTIFDNNIAKNGAAIYLDGGSQAEIGSSDIGQIELYDKVSFTNNKALEYGSAIYTKKAYITQLSDDIVIKHNASIMGGAIDGSANDGINHGATQEHNEAKYLLASKTVIYDNYLLNADGTIDTSKQRNVNINGITFDNTIDKNGNKYRINATESKIGIFSTAPLDTYADPTNNTEIEKQLVFDGWNATKVQGFGDAKVYAHKVFVSEDPQVLYAGDSASGNGSLNNPNTNSPYRLYIGDKTQNSPTLGGYIAEVKFTDTSNKAVAIDSQYVRRAYFAHIDYPGELEDDDAQKMVFRSWGGRAFVYNTRNSQYEQANENSEYTSMWDFKNNVIKIDSSTLTYDEIYSVWGINHGHKVCGCLNGTPCNHDTFTDAKGNLVVHSDKPSWLKVGNSVASMLAGPFESYILDQDLVVDQSIHNTIFNTIINNEEYSFTICLNGHNLILANDDVLNFSGFDFNGYGTLSNANVGINICNCKNEGGVITTSTHSNVRSKPLIRSNDATVAIWSSVSISHRIVETNEDKNDSVYGTYNTRAAVLDAFGTSKVIFNGVVINDIETKTGGFSNGGSAILLRDNAEAVFYGGEYYNNKTEMSGGLISATDNAKLNILQSTFSGINGYGILNKHRDAYFHDNEAEFSGGAIFIDGNAKVNISGNENNEIVFENNKSKAYGGAIYVDDSALGNTSNLSLNNITFNKNVAAQGGALAGLSNPTSTRIIVELKENITFTNNEATSSVAVGNIYGGKGGAIWSAGAYMNFTDSKTTIIENNIARLGGAIAMECFTDTDYCKIKFNDEIEFNNNKAYEAGGAIYAKILGYNEQRIQASKMTFTNNSTLNSDGKGGAVALVGNAQQDFENVIFKNNNSNMGGAIYLKNHASMKFARATFEKNEADYGGAIYYEQDESVDLVSKNLSYNIETLESVTFKENSSNKEGGAIYIKKSGNIITTKAMAKLGGNFESNTSRESGGAVYLLTEDTNITKPTQFTEVYFDNALFTKNQSGKDGGAISVHNLIDKGLRVSAGDNVSFTENEAWGDGGAISIFQEARMTSVESLVNFVGEKYTFTQNVSNGDAGGGAIYATYSYTNASSIFINVGSSSSRSIANSNKANANDSKGGFAYLYNVSANFENIDIKENKSSGAGSAIYHNKTESAGSTFNLKDVDVRYNTNLSGSASSDNGAIIVSTYSSLGLSGVVIIKDNGSDNKKNLELLGNEDVLGKQGTNSFRSIQSTFNASLSQIYLTSYFKDGFAFTGFTDANVGDVDNYNIDKIFISDDKMKDPDHIKLTLGSGDNLNKKNKPNVHITNNYKTISYITDCDAIIPSEYVMPLDYHKLNNIVNVTLDRKQKGLVASDSFVSWVTKVAIKDYNGAKTTVNAWCEVEPDKDVVYFNEDDPDVLYVYPIWQIDYIVKNEEKNNNNRTLDSYIDISHDRECGCVDCNHENQLVTTIHDELKWYEVKYYEQLYYQSNSKYNYKTANDQITKFGFILANDITSTQSQLIGEEGKGFVLNTNGHNIFINYGMQLASSNANGKVIISNHEKGVISEIKVSSTLSDTTIKTQDMQVYGSFSVTGVYYADGWENDPKAFINASDRLIIGDGGTFDIKNNKDIAFVSGDGFYYGKGNVENNTQTKLAKNAAGTNDNAHFSMFDLRKSGSYNSFTLQNVTFRRNTYNQLMTYEDTDGTTGTYKIASLSFIENSAFTTVYSSNIQYNLFKFKANVSKELTIENLKVEDNSYPASTLFSLNQTIFKIKDVVFEKNIAFTCFAVDGGGGNVKYSLSNARFVNNSQGISTNNNYSPCVAFINNAQEILIEDTIIKDNIGYGKGALMLTGDPRVGQGYSQDIVFGGKVIVKNNKKWDNKQFNTFINSSRTQYTGTKIDFSTTNLLSSKSEIGLFLNGISNTSSEKDFNIAQNTWTSNKKSMGVVYNKIFSVDDHNFVDYVMAKNGNSIVIIRKSNTSLREVTYYMFGNSDFSGTQYLIYPGTTLDEPESPTPSNPVEMTFAGWYANRKLTEKYDFNKNITSQIVQDSVDNKYHLYARFAGPVTVSIITNTDGYHRDYVNENYKGTVLPEVYIKGTQTKISTGTIVAVLGNAIGDQTRKMEEYERKHFTHDGYYEKNGFDGDKGYTNGENASKWGEHWTLSTPAVTETMNLYLMWKPNTYSLVFKDDTVGVGSTKINIVVASLSAQYNNKIPAYDNYGSLLGENIATRSGYTPTGWYLDNTFAPNKKITPNDTYYVEKEIDSLTVFDGNQELYASWSALYYHINLNPNGQETVGNTSGDKLVRFDEKTTLGSATENNISFSRTGYHISGWDEVKRDVLGKDGKGDVGPLIASKAEVIVNQFLAKLETSTISYVPYIRNLNNGEDNVNKVNLYAHWEANQYKVTFDKNEYSDGQYVEVTGMPADMTMWYDTIATLPEAKSAYRKGYTLYGFDLDKNATWSSTATNKYTFEKGEVLPYNTNFTSTDSETVTLYAIWGPIKYPYTIYSNSLNMDKDKTIEVYNNYGVDYASVTNAYGGKFDFTGFTLDGFYATNGVAMKADGTYDYENPSYDDSLWGSKWEFLGNANVTKVKATTSIFARWRENSYTIKFDSNSPSSTKINDYVQTNTIKGTTPDLVASYTEVTTIMKGKTKGDYTTDTIDRMSSITLDGWNLLGYSSKSNSKTAEYTKDITFTRLSSGSLSHDKTVNFYAVWEPNTYFVKYDQNKGTGSSAVYGIVTNSELKYDYLKQTLKKNAYYRDGYDFIGWSTKSDVKVAEYKGDGSDVGKFNFTTTSNATYTLYAIWKARNYTVYFKATPDVINGTNFISGDDTSETYTFDKIQKLATPNITRDGYLFKEWILVNPATNSNYKTKYASAQEVLNLTTLSESLNMYAIWTPDNYEINYHLNDVYVAVLDKKSTTFASISTTTKSVTFSEQIGDLAIPTRDGYTFNGWYQKQEMNPDATPVYSATKAIIYDHLWYDKTSNSMKEDTYAGNREIYAHWLRNVYTVKYDVNTPSGMVVEGKAWDDETHKFDIIWEIPQYDENQFKVKGFTYEALMQDTDYRKATYYNAKQKVATSNLAKTSGSEVILYASWSEHTYKVVYDANNPIDKKTGEIYPLSNGATRSTASHLYRSLFNIHTDIATESLLIDGYDFLGWDTNKNFDVKSAAKTLFAEGEATASLAGGGYNEAGENDIYTLYAIWRPASYRVEFVASDSEATGKTLSQFFEIGGEYENLSTMSFTLLGHTFQYWEDTRTKATYADAEAVRNLRTVKNDCATLSAVWKEHTYNITFDYATPVSPDKSTSNVVIGSKATIENVLYRSDFVTIGNENIEINGYTFVAWHDQYGNTEDENGKKYDANYVANRRAATYSDMDEFALTASWSNNKYKISLDHNIIPGTREDDTKDIYKEMEVYYDKRYDAIATLPTLVRGGYTFSGWYSKVTTPGDADYEQYIVTNSDIVKHYGNNIGDTVRTLYAHWEPRTYKLTLFASTKSEMSGWYTKQVSNKNVKLQSITMEVRFEQAISTTSIATPTLPGYTFVNYNKSVDGTGDTVNKDTKFWAYDDEQKIYAIWDANKYYLTFDGGKENVKGTIATISMTYDNAQDVFIPEIDETNDIIVEQYKLEGHTFVRWDYINPETKTDDSNKNTIYKSTYANAEKVKNIRETSASTAIFKASWSEHTYHILFEKATPESPEKGMINKVVGNMSTQSLLYTATKSLTQNDYQIIGYTFKYWSTDKDDNKTDRATFANAQEVSRLAGKDYGVKGENNVYQLYAIYEPNTYSVTLNLQDETDGKGSTKAYYKYANNNATESFANNYVVIATYDRLYTELGRTNRTDKEADSFIQARRFGYTFVGWATYSSATRSGVLLKSQSHRIPNDTTIYAVWEKLSWGVNFRIFTRDFNPITLDILKIDKNDRTQEAEAHILWFDEKVGEASVSGAMPLPKPYAKVFTFNGFAPDFTWDPLDDQATPNSIIIKDDTLVNEELINALSNVSTYYKNGGVNIKGHYTEINPNGAQKDIWELKENGVVIETQDRTETSTYRTPTYQAQTYVNQFGETKDIDFTFTAWWGGRANQVLLDTLTYREGDGIGIEKKDANGKTYTDRIPTNSILGIYEQPLYITNGESHTVPGTSSEPFMKDDNYEVTRRGYTFHGFHTATVPYINDYTLYWQVSDGEVYADWTANTYNVYFNANIDNGNFIGTNKFSKNITIFEEDNPSNMKKTNIDANRDDVVIKIKQTYESTISIASWNAIGYKFIEWNTKPDGSGEKYSSTGSFVVGKNDLFKDFHSTWTDKYEKAQNDANKPIEFNVYAIYEPIEYTITLNGSDLYGGSTTPSMPMDYVASKSTVSVTFDDLLTNYEALKNYPTRDGYFFGFDDYKYKDNNFSDTTKKNYKVYYQANSDGVVTTTTKEFDVPNVNFNPTTDAEKAKYKFTNAGNLSFDAQWTPKVYNITFDGNKGTGSTTPKVYNINGISGNVFSDKQVAKMTFDSYFDDTSTSTRQANWQNYSKNNTYNKGKLPEADRVGYEFLGWNTNANGTGATLSVTDRFSTPSDTTYYAIWKAKEIQVTFVPQDITRKDGVDVPVQTQNSRYYGSTIATLSTVSITVKFDELVGSEISTLERDGYTFNGWYTVDKFDGALVTNSADSTRKQNGRYAENETIKGMQVTDTTKFDTSIYLSRMSGKTVADLKPADVKDLTLYPLYERKENKVIYYASDSNMSYGSSYGHFVTETGAKVDSTITKPYYDMDKVYFDLPIEINNNKTFELKKQLPTITRLGYTFKKWTSSPSEGIEINNKTIVTTTSNINAYALWEVRTFTVKYQDNRPVKTNSSYAGQNAPLANEKVVYYDAKGGNTNTLQVVFDATYSNLPGFSRIVTPSIASPVFVVPDRRNNNVFTPGGWTFQSWNTSDQQTKMYGATINDESILNFDLRSNTETFNGQAGKSQYLYDDDIKHEQYLYPVWKENTYEIIYVENIPFASYTEIGRDTVKYTEWDATNGLKYNIGNTPELKNPSKEGFTFLGWSMSSTSETPEFNQTYALGDLTDPLPIRYVNGDNNDTRVHNETTQTKGKIYRLSPEDESEVKLYAIWEALAYKITYINEDTGLEFTQSQKLEAANKALPSTYKIDKDVTVGIPSRRRYDFEYWTYLRPDDTIGTSSDPVVIPAESENDRVFTASWIAKNFAITLDPNALQGGIGEEIVLPMTTEESLTLPAASTFTNTNKLKYISYWCTDPTGKSGQSFRPRAKLHDVSDGDDLILYAIWAGG
ncbi:MAG: InlB B-repeat-containing protein, partial [Eubacteriales bacterium]|nr:InlB B-repeat-containing protein [Eubacteriales bacterium]